MLNHLNLKLELYFYLDTVNLSDKIIILLQSIITVTIYFNLYKHDLKFKSKIEKNKEILLYIDAVCVLSIQRKKLRQPFRKDGCRNFIRTKSATLWRIM